MAAFLARMIELYLALGAVFGVGFALFGAQRLDPDARGAGLGFRVLVLPGAALLWPLLAWRLARGAAAPAERTAHKLVAGGEEGTP